MVKPDVVLRCIVFRNQARGETKTPKRFINDTMRNDFHRKLSFCREVHEGTVLCG